MKGAGRRVDELIDYLCAEVPGAERAGVRTFLVARRDIARTFSDEMSSKHLEHPGNAPERMRRRALMMLTGLSGGTVQDIHNVRALGAAQVTTTLAARVLALRYIADQASGTGAVIASVYNNSSSPSRHSS
jgi:hypothetical protein